MDFKHIIKNILFNIWPSYREAKIVEWRVDSLRAMLKTELTLMDRKNQMLFWYLFNQPNETIEESKMRFFRMIPPATGELREFQLKNAELLKKLKLICENNGLTMWLEGGSLLGAIRHGGFIPWDDDIDVNMWKEDLEKLKLILHDSSELIIRNKFNYYLNCIVPGIEPRDGSGGWVDIFPMQTINSLPRGFEGTKQYINEQCKAMKRELAKSLNREPADIEFLDMEGIDIKNIQKVKNIMQKYMDKLPCSVVDDCCYRSLSALNAPGGADLFYMTSVFPLRECKFENEIYLVPNNSELWLNTYYGDYLRVPLNISPKHFK